MPEIQILLMGYNNDFTMYIISQMLIMENELIKNKIVFVSLIRHEIDLFKGVVDTVTK